MASGSFLLHGARGKVGNIVARKGPKGGTVLAERVTPKNPQTNKQMAQRIILATIAQAAKFMSPIVDHSFQGVAVGAACKERFRKLNMDKMRQLAAVDFEEVTMGIDSHAFMTTKNVQALIPNPYVISTGNLSPVKFTFDIDHPTGGTDYHFFLKFTDFSIYPQGEAEGVRSITLGDLLKNLFGIVTTGEQITFVMIQKSGMGVQYAYNGDTESPGFVIPFTSMRAVRLFVSPTVDLTQEIAVTDNQGAPLANIDTAIVSAIIGAFSDSARTDRGLLAWFEDRLTNSLSASVNAETGFVDIELDPTEKFDITNYNSDDDGLGYIYALGVIRSRLMTDGSWQYSNSSMKIARPIGEQERNFGLYWNAAIQAWFEGSQVTSDELYLRAGTEQNEIGESFT